MAIPYLLLTSACGCILIVTVFNSSSLPPSLPPSPSLPSSSFFTLCPTAADFDGTTLTGSFPASPVPDSIQFHLTVTNDAINEATEVYILQIEITASSDTVTLENEGVSRVLILDDDGQYVKEGPLWYSTSR